MHKKIAINAANESYITNEKCKELQRVAIENNVPMIEGGPPSAGARSRDVCIDRTGSRGTEEFMACYEDMSDAAAKRASRQIKEEKKSSGSRGGSTFCQVMPGTQILHCW